jgi:hypothetical protein
MALIGLIQGKSQWENPERSTEWKFCERATTNSILREPQ